MHFCSKYMNIHIVRYTVLATQSSLLESQKDSLISSSLLAAVGPWQHGSTPYTGGQEA